MIRENSLFDFSSFKFIEIYFMSQGISYLGEYSVVLEKMYILLFLGGILCICHLNPIG